MNALLCVAPILWWKTGEEKGLLRTELCILQLGAVDGLRVTLGLLSPHLSKMPHRHQLCALSIYLLSIPKPAKGLYYYLHDDQKLQNDTSNGHDLRRSILDDRLLLVQAGIQIC